MGSRAAAKIKAPAKPLRTRQSQLRPHAHATRALAGVDAALQGGGQPLEPKLRATMQQHFGHDFSDVRVHAGDRHEACVNKDRPCAGSPLPSLCRRNMEQYFGRPLDRVRIHVDSEGEAVAGRHGALAVSQGDHLHFAKNVYAPGTTQGDRVLRHELTHYLQRRGKGTPWPTSLLETEAELAANRLSGSIHVHGYAAGTHPLAMKTYVSTVGGNPYLDVAVKFYKLWENETATRIGSYQAVVDDLAKDKSALDAFRIVAHANGINLFLPLLTAGKGYAGVDFLGLQTQETLALKYSELGHITGDMTATIHGWLKKKDPGKSLLGKFKMDSALSGLVKDWVWWVVDEHFADNAKEDPPKAKQKATAAADIASLKAEVSKAQNAIKPALVVSLPSGVTSSDVDTLRTATLDAFRAEKWTWGNLAPGELKGRLDRLTHPDVTSFRKALEGGTFESNLKSVKSRVSDKTHIEIRGCNIGSNDAYLNGIREFFGTKDPAGVKTDRLPSISAPKLYQYFGSPGAIVVPEGKKHPPVADSLKFLFEETFDDKSLAEDVKKAIKKAKLADVAGLVKVLRFADIRGEFERWWQMKQKAKGVAAKDIKAATLKNFQDFLTSKPPATFPVNAPGISAESLWFLILTPSAAIDALLAWVKAQGYSLPGGADPLKTFFKGSSSWDAAKFAEGQKNILVDWLGDTYPVPAKVIFPEDPEYKANIRRLP